jgi:hypothetical protein
MNPHVLQPAVPLVEPAESLLSRLLEATTALPFLPQGERTGASVAEPAARPHLVQRRTDDTALTLTELSPVAVFDHLDGEGVPISLISFGAVRECCPKCQGAHLKLILRQRAVRAAHLFCEHCESCFDAHYPNGEPALSW